MTTVPGCPPCALASSRPRTRSRRRCPPSRPRRGSGRTLDRGGGQKRRRLHFTTTTTTTISRHTQVFVVRRPDGGCGDGVSRQPGQAGLGGQGGRRRRRGGAWKIADASFLKKETKAFLAHPWACCLLTIHFCATFRQNMVGENVFLFIIIEFS